MPVGQWMGGPGGTRFGFRRYWYRWYTSALSRPAGPSPRIDSPRPDLRQSRRAARALPVPYGRFQLMSERGDIESRRRWDIFGTVSEIRPERSQNLSFLDI